MTNADMLRLIARKQAAGEKFCVATVVRARAATAAKAGAKALIDPGGNMQGFIGGGCARAAAKDAAAKAFADGQARLVRVQPKGAPAAEDGIETRDSNCPSRGSVDIFVEPLAPLPLLCVLGGSPVATALAAMAAQTGYRTLAFGEPEDEDAFVAGVKFCAGYNLAKAGVGKDDFVVVATQGKNDLTAAAAAAQTPANYVAMISSRAKGKHLRQQLQAQGINAARIKAPAGLDIGGIEAQEIALSVLAEIIQQRRRGKRDGTKGGKNED